MSEKENISFADKLDYLFRMKTKGDGSEYTYVEVQAGTENAISAEYIRKLRQGLAENPGYRVISALANFFEVDPNYFFDIEESGVEAIDPLTRKITLRAAELDDSGRRAILDMLDYIEELREEMKKGGGET